ncbi:MAG: hypothetical protein U0798_04430 [Gemmataceae bacterium]
MSWCLEAVDAETLGLFLYDYAWMAHTNDSAFPGPRVLPRITLGGRRFIVDSRLAELRAEDDPHYRFEFHGKSN